MTRSDTRKVAPFRRRMIDQMRMANLAENTQYATIFEIRRLARHTRQSPDRLDAEQVRARLKGRIDCGRKPRSTNVPLVVPRFLYRYVFRRLDLVEGLRNRRGPRTLPRPARRKRTGAQLQTFHLPDWRHGDVSTDSRFSVRTRGSGPRVDDRRKCRFGQPHGDRTARLGCERGTLSRLLNGKAGVSANMALALEDDVWVTAEHWMRMQASYELARRVGRRLSPNGVRSRCTHDRSLPTNRVESRRLSVIRFRPTARRWEIAPSSPATIPSRARSSRGRTSAHRGAGSPHSARMAACSIASPHGSSRRESVGTAAMPGLALMRPTRSRRANRSRNSGRYCLEPASWRCLRARDFRPGFG